MDPRSRRGERGFTVIELLITLAVSLIALMGLLSLSIGMTAGSRSSVRATEAIALAGSALEELRRESLDDLIAVHGPLPIATRLADTVGRNSLLFARRLLVEEVAGDDELVRVRIEISWNDVSAAPQADATDEHRIVLEVLRDEGGVVVP